MYYIEHTVKSFDGTPLYVRESGEKDRPLLLFVNEWSVVMTLDRNKGLKLSEFGPNEVLQ